MTMAVCITMAEYVVAKVSKTHEAVAYTLKTRYTHTHLVLQDMRAVLQLVDFGGVAARVQLQERRHNKKNNWPAGCVLLAKQLV